jgi:hypothetical protein
MARWLRRQKQLPLLVLSFLLSSIYRMIVGAWPTQLPTADASSHRFALELDRTYPFLHVRQSAPRLAPVALSTPCLSQAVSPQAVNTMQFGFVPIGGEGEGPGVCQNLGNFPEFTDNPPVAAPPINIGEPGSGCGGCGDCGNCLSCIIVGNCCACDDCCNCGGCYSPIPPAPTTGQE